MAWSCAKCGWERCSWCDSEAMRGELAESHRSETPPYFDSLQPFEAGPGANVNAALVVHAANGLHLVVFPAGANAKAKPQRRCEYVGCRVLYTPNAPRRASTSRRAGGTPGPSGGQRRGSKTPPTARGSMATGDVATSHKPKTSSKR